MDGNSPNDFASVYERYAAFMRRALARRGVRAADLDDVTQEAFVVAHRRLPTFEGRSSLGTWLEAIAWRTAANYHRRSPRHRGLELEDTHALADSGTNDALMQEDLPAACEELEPELRDLILLHDIGGLTVSELSSLTGRARATIRQRLERARALLARRSGRLGELDRSASFVSLDAGPPAQTEPPRMQLLSNKQVCYSSLDDVLIHVRSGPTTAEDLRRGGHTMEAMLAAHPDGFRYLCVIESSSAPPTLDGRQVNAELARRYGSKFHAVSVAVESSMLMRVAAPILNSYFVLARSSINIRFFNAGLPAIEWLARDRSEQGALVEHVAAMRACLERADL